MPRAPSKLDPAALAKAGNHAYPVKDFSIAPSTGGRRPKLAKLALLQSMLPRRGGGRDEDTPVETKTPKQQQPGLNKPTRTAAPSNTSAKGSPSALVGGQSDDDDVDGTGTAEVSPARERRLCSNDVALDPSKTGIAALLAGDAAKDGRTEAVLLTGRITAGGGAIRARLDGSGFLSVQFGDDAVASREPGLRVSLLPERCAGRGSMSGIPTGARIHGLAPSGWGFTELGIVVRIDCLLYSCSARDSSVAGALVSCHHLLGTPMRLLLLLLSHGLLLTCFLCLLSRIVLLSHKPPFHREANNEIVEPSSYYSSPFFLLALFWCIYLLQERVLLS